MVRGTLEPTCSFTLLGFQGTGSTPLEAVAATVRLFWKEALCLLEDAAPAPASQRVRENLLMILDRARLRAAVGEDSRWLAYLISLEQQTRAGEVSTAQRGAVLGIWHAVRARLPTLRRPTVGRAAGGECYLTWAFTDQPHATLSIELDPQGALSWFFRDRQDGRQLGSDEESLTGLPEQVFELLRAWA